MVYSSGNFALRAKLPEEIKIKYHAAAGLKQFK
jgi:hypothetical protein